MSEIIAEGKDYGFKASIIRALISERLKDEFKADQFALELDIYRAACAEAQQQRES